MSNAFYWKQRLEYNCISVNCNWYIIWTTNHTFTGRAETICGRSHFSSFWRIAI